MQKKAMPRRQTFTLSVDDFKALLALAQVAKSRIVHAKLGYRIARVQCTCLEARLRISRIQEIILVAAAHVATKIVFAILIALANLVTLVFIYQHTCVLSTASE